MEEWVVEMKMTIEIKIKYFMFLLFNVTFLLQAKKLSEVEGIQKLSNYQEIKNIEVERIFEKSANTRALNVINDITYLKGEKKVFNGVLIAREDNDIVGIYQYSNGKGEGISNDYYRNGQLKIKLFYRNNKLFGEGNSYYENGKIKDERNYVDGIMVSSTEYYMNGKIKDTLKSLGGKNALVIAYYENGVKSLEKEVIQERGDTGITYINNGKALVYDKKGNLFGELQLRNNSTVGQKQKFYENNRLKYEFIAGSELNEPAKPSQYYIEYYDNSDKVAMHCEEKPNGSWTCKEYKKDGTFKREKDYPTVIYKQRGTKDWINYLLPVLKVFGL